MTAEPLPTWLDLCHAQGQVLARRQALALGMSGDTWQWAHEQRRMRRLLPGVSLGHAGEPSLEQRAWAAVLHCGDGAALTGDLALALLGMRLDAPRAIDVAVPESRVVRPGAALALEPPVPVLAHRVKGLTSLVHPARTPPTVRLPVALLHAAAFARSDRAAEWRVAAAVQQRLMTPAHVREALERMPRLRRRALVLAVLDDVELGAHAASELAFLRLLRRHGLPLPDRLQRPVRHGRTRYLDGWWERQRVGVEIDGSHHVEVGQWDDDVLRANDVVVAERHDRALLLRYTCGNLRHDEPQVASQLAAVLR